MGPDEQAGLLESVRSLDPDAWEHVYRRSYASLLAYARRRLPVADDADDAVSEALARAVATIERFEDRGLRLEAWLFGILRNVVLEHVRRGRRTAPLPDSHDVEAPEPGPLEGVLAAELTGSVRLAFARLREDDQELLWLRLVAGLSAAEVSQVVGRREGAVRQGQSRALGRLRQLLEEVHP
ncbi:RNA polymerase sigma factor [Aquipuribacter sp. SD81]|uniref:RNA polymerase sigma factor n=1 Tax=Aquipuribacter sp. SD81 TaxID=3127703 RepID=UPI00301AD9D4